MVLGRVGVALREQEEHGMGHRGAAETVGIPTAADSFFLLPVSCGQRRTEDNMSAVVSTAPPPLLSPGL